MTPGNAREAAFLSLLRIEKESRYSNLETDLTLKKQNLSDADARLYTRLFYGTLERKLTLDYILSKLTSKPLEKLDREVTALLRLSAYQILYADRIPDSAAVNEGVELCKKYRKSAAPMVNAVLRRLIREREALAFPSEEKEPVAYLSAFFSVSPDICALFLDRFGMEETKKLLAAMNETPPTALRVNTLKTSREALAERLRVRGILCEETALSPCGLKVRAAISDLPELSEGLCFVQDEASQLCTAALNAQPGMTLLDLCACPGGKSFGAAMTMENSGKIVSFDLHANKLPLIEKGAERLGVSILSTAAADARVFLPEWEEKADRILCDVPCSGLGVLAKKPEIRYKDLAESEKLPQIQKDILDNACRYLKKGGRLIYSTCTLLRRENEEIVDGFLASHPDFEEAPLDLPGNLAAGASRLTLLPHIHGTDGFFIAAIGRKE